MQNEKQTNDCLERLKNYTETYTDVKAKAKAILEFLNSNHECNSTYTLKEIAEVFGITRERVRQIESSAMKKLKHPKLGWRLKKVFN